MEKFIAKVSQSLKSLSNASSYELNQMMKKLTHNIDVPLLWVGKKMRWTGPCCQ